jgi:hypothetical protein
VGRTLLVPVLLRRILRRRPTVDHQGVHREPEAAQLTVTDGGAENSGAPRLRSKDAIPPRRKTPGVSSQDRSEPTWPSGAGPHVVTRPQVGNSAHSGSASETGPVYPVWSPGSRSQPVRRRCGGCQPGGRP